MENKHYTFTKNIKDNPLHRESFNQLTRDTFDFDFSTWYQGGYWHEHYQPYSLLEGDNVIANVSVNVFEMMHGKHREKHIQLGTVMTHPDHRKRGCADFLINEVLKDYAAEADAVYLYADAHLASFYQGFGFEQKTNYIFEMVVTEKTKLDRIKMDYSEYEKIVTYFKRGNPYAKISSIENTGLLFFYLAQFLKDAIYYLPEEDLIVIYDTESHCLYDVFGLSSKIPLDQIIASFETGNKTRLGFTPKNLAGVSMLENNEEPIFFYKGNHEEPQILPLLTIA